MSVQNDMPADSVWAQPPWALALSILSCPTFFGLVALAANGGDGCNAPTMTSGQAFMTGFVGWFAFVALIGLITTVEVVVKNSHRLLFNRRVHTR